MNDLRKAAEMALETLCVGANDAVPNDIDERFEQAIQALRQALAQPEQEPVYAFRRKGLDDFCTCDKRRYDELAGKPNLFEVTVFYTAPPKREWVGLTDVNEMVEAELTHYWNGEYELTTGARNHLTDFAQAIEAKLKEKNG